MRARLNGLRLEAKRGALARAIVVTWFSANLVACSRASGAATTGARDGATAAPRVVGSTADAAGTADAAVPGRVAPTLRATTIELGGSEACARLEDGTVRCWGRGSLLVPGAPDVRTTPVIAPELAAFEQWSLGTARFDRVGFGCGVRGGQVYCWGDNSEGQLGDGSAVPVRREIGAPVRGIRDARSVVIDRANACAIRANGRVSCWGSNDHQEFADGTPIQRRVPIELPRLSDVETLSLGYRRGCAVTRARALFCWGRNAAALSPPTDESLYVLPQPVDVGGQASRVAVGVRHTCVLRADGTVACWGSGLGFTTIADVSDAIDVRYGGRDDFYALGRDGRLRRWVVTAGLNQEVARGYTPVELVAGGDHVAQVRGGSDGSSSFVCVLRTDGEVACWGSNGAAQLAQGTAPRDRADPSTVPGLSDAMQIVAAEHAVCAVRASGRVACWGDPLWFEMEGGPAGDAVSTPSEVPGIVDATQVVFAWGLACVRRRNGSVGCWGSDRAVLGSFVSEASSALVAVPSVTDAVGLAAGASHVCALQRSGTVSCWGPRAIEVRARPDHAQGAGEEIEVGPAPTVLPGVTRAEWLAAGGYQTCVREDASPGVLCGGRWVSFGRLALAPPQSPSAIEAIANTDVVALGSECSCVSTPDRRVRCWCARREGAIGPQSGTPQLVAGLRAVVGLAVAEDHACALDESGDVHCWGANARGQLGRPTARGGRTRVASRVLQLAGPAAEVVVGREFSCARLRDGRVQCWGANEDGQLGDGVVLGAREPLAVRW
ncbi:MAG: hypothetical protein JNK05_38170 [Myxococcales bacterium]|nr:hypothetical protein [Myxococcales bacterium]